MTRSEKLMAKWWRVGLVGFFYTPLLRVLQLFLVLLVIGLGVAFSEGEFFFDMGFLVVFTGMFYLGWVAVFLGLFEWLLLQIIETRKI